MNEARLTEPLNSFADHCINAITIALTAGPLSASVPADLPTVCIAPYKPDPLPPSIGINIRVLARLAYDLGREHEKAEADLINEAHIDALDKQSDSRTLAIVAGVMAQLDLSTLKLDLSSVARVFNDRMLTTSMTEPGFVEYHLTQRPKEY